MTERADYCLVNPCDENKRAFFNAARHSDLSRCIVSGDYDTGIKEVVYHINDCTVVINYDNDTDYCPVRIIGNKRPMERAVSRLEKISGLRFHSITEIK